MEGASLRTKVVVAVFLVGLPFAAGIASIALTTGLRSLIVASATVVAVAAGFLYYRLSVVQKFFFVDETVVRCCAHGLPIVVGVAVWAGTGDWRWCITGLLVGAALPGLGQALWETVSYESGCVMAPIFLGATSLLVGLLVWLWTSDPMGMLLPAATVGTGVLILLGALFVKIDPY